LEIRKISIGPDYKSGSMHYVHNQSVLNGAYIIYLIQKVVDSNSYKIWIQGDGEILLWKEFNENMPISIEYNINF